MKKNNNSGFTLIELIVCLCIIAILGIVISVNYTSMMKNNEIKNSKEIVNRINDALRTCNRLSDSNKDCNTLGGLIKTGLLDESVYEEINPITCNKYNASDSFTLNNDKIIYNGKDMTEEGNWGDCS